MTAQSKTTLKGYFNTGDIPTEAQFANLIDSFPQGDVTPTLEELTASSFVFAAISSTITYPFTTDILHPHPPQHHPIQHVWRVQGE